MTQKANLFKGQQKKKLIPPSRRGKIPHNRKGKRLVKPSKVTKEMDADRVMAIIADFMLVWFPAPTVSLRQALAIHAGPFAKFFYGCPDNAFQVALAGTSYSFLQSRSHRGQVLAYV